jgi:predicted MFS family arabinose efflux permease
MLTYHHEDARAPEPESQSPQVTTPPSAEEPTTAKARRSAWRVLRHRDFRWYFLGSLTSNLGTWMQTTAQVVLVYQLTHSVFAVGVVTSAQFAGTLFLGPWAAVVASHIGGKRTLIFTQLASAGVAAVLAALERAGSLDENGLILGALVMGLLFAIALPIQTAMIPRLVPENQRDAEAAMAMNSVSYNAGRALAPALSVVVIATIGFKWAFALNAISCLVYVLMLARVRPRGSDKPARPADVRDGGRAARKAPRILLLLALVAAVTLADDPVLILGPALAHQLHVSSSWPGYFLSALGLGTVLGSMWPTRAPKSRNESKTSHRAAGWLLFLAAAVVLFSMGIAAWVSLVAAFAAGVAALRTGAVTQTQLLRLRPVYAASVMGLWAICWAGSKPLASFFDGWLASVVPHLWIAAVALALPAALLAFAEIVLPKRIKRWIRGQAFRVGITSSPAVVSIPLDDRQPSPKRLGSPNGVRVTSVTNAPPFNGHATGQLTHHPSKVPTARSTHSPYHHQPVR